MNAIAKACYSGTMIRDLEGASARIRKQNALEAAAERLMRHNSLPCECGFALGQHSHIGRRCPDPNGYWRNRTFKELRCEASVVRGLSSGGEQCGAPVKAGQRMCEEHYVE